MKQTKKQCMWRLKLCTLAVVAMQSLQVIIAKPLSVSNAEPVHASKVEPIHVLERKTYKDPRFPERMHAYLHLSNALKVWITSDKLTSSSGAAVVVNAGSAQDPTSAPGLAHFCEHMLFISTDKYPEVDGYFDFVHKHNGVANAYTASDHTAYYFTMSPQGFSEGLDRLAQFFITPSFNTHYIHKELRAVDAEHSKNIKSIPWRLQRALQTLFSKDHTLSQFSTGNSQTLASITKQELQAFFKRYYQANNMQVAVVDTRSLEEIEREVLKAFAALPNQHLVTKTPLGVPFETKDSNVLEINHLKALGQESLMKLSVFLPSTRTSYQANTLGFLDSLLEQKAKGSLIATLLQQDWVADVSVGSRFEGDSFDQVDMIFRLTPSGLERTNDILALTQAYVALLAKPLPAYLYEQRKQTAKIAFDNASRPSAHAVVAQAQQLAYVEPDDMLRSGAVYTGFDQTLWEKTLKNWQPERMKVVVSSPKEHADRNEVFYGLDYSITKQAFPSLSAESKSLAKALRVPDKNPFVPEKPIDYVVEQPKFQMMPILAYALERMMGIKASSIPPQGTVFNSISELLSSLKGQVLAEDITPLVETYAYTQPERLVGNPRMKLWYQPNRQFKKATVLVDVSQDKTTLTAKRYVTQMLWFWMFSKELEQRTYAAAEAQYTSSYEATATGVQVAVSGYPEKLGYFVDALVNVKQKFTPTRDTFNTYKKMGLESFEGYAENTGTQRQIHDATYTILYPYVFTPSEMYEALSQLSFEEFKEHHAALKRPGASNAVCYGNIKAALCQASADKMVSEWVSGALKKQDIPVWEPRSLRKGDWSLDFITQQVDSGGWLLWNYGPVTPLSLRFKAMANSLLQPAFFKEMRTERNLGYIAQAGFSSVGDYDTLNLYLQSNTKAASYLVAQSTAYAKDNLRQELNTSKQNFDEIKQAVEQGWLGRSHHPYSEARTLLHLILEKKAVFSYYEALFQTIREATFEAYTAYIQSRAKQAPFKLSVAAQGTGDNRTASDQEGHKASKSNVKTQAPRHVSIDSYTQKVRLLLKELSS